VTKEIIEKRSNLKKGEILTAQDQKYKSEVPRRVKYVRHKIIMADIETKLDEVIYGNNENRSYTRKCGSWYVVGHWRTYKTGKKIFIQPYWKGPLREFRRSNSDRIREIVEENVEISEISGGNDEGQLDDHQGKDVGQGNQSATEV